jgi:hypothetical protein
LIGPDFKRGQFGLDAGAGVLCGVVGHEAVLGSIVSRPERDRLLRGVAFLAYACRGERRSKKSH